MSQEETYFDQQVGNKRVVVLKSYDKLFAREAFEQMMPEALEFLEGTLNLTSHGDVEVLWEGIEDGAREDWNAFSYFIVSETASGPAASIFVSSDWPSAEAFATQRLAAASSY